MLRLDSVDSTNALAMRLLRAGKLADRTIISARCQTRGQGTHGRHWASPRDAGIYMSVVQRDVHFARPVPAMFTQAAGVACVEILRRCTGVKISLKPINDLWVNGAKLGGVLTELLVEAGRPLALITGIGINLSNVDRDVGPGAAPVTSLQNVMTPSAYSSLNVRDIIAELAESVFRWNHVAASGDRSVVEGAWRECLATVTRPET